MTEQQQHLKQLLEQRNQLEVQLNSNRELFLKLQGAIEYLVQIGVTLPQEETNSEETNSEGESSEEEKV
jgi:hypothetical protein